MHIVCVCEEQLIRADWSLIGMWWLEDLVCVMGFDWACEIFQVLWVHPGHFLQVFMAAVLLPAHSLLSSSITLTSFLTLPPPHPPTLSPQILFLSFFPPSPISCTGDTDWLGMRMATKSGEMREICFASLSSLPPHNSVSAKAGQDMRYMVK